MTVRTDRLAQRFIAANDELLRIVKSCTPAQWQRMCEDEHWSVGVTAHHVANAYPFMLSVVQAAAKGRTGNLPTGEILSRLNDEHAREYADCTIPDTIEMFETNAAAILKTIRSLTDQELDRPLLGDVPVTAEQLLSGILIGHIESHAESIRKAIRP